MSQSPTGLWGESTQDCSRIQNFLVSLPACPPLTLGQGLGPQFPYGPNGLLAPSPDDCKVSCNRVLGDHKCVRGFPLFPSFKEIPVWPLGTKGVTLYCSRQVNPTVARDSKEGPQS